MLERVVHRQVYVYVNRRNILSKAQFGFRKAHSTTTCVLSLLDYIYSSFNEEKLVGVVFLYLKTAFDTVDHDILLKKLNKYGQCANALDWFTSYLNGRYQVNKVLGTVSDALPIICGVPQGSIQGSLLFILYISDLVDYLGDARIGLYADDTAIYYASRSPIELALTRKIELDMVSEWLRANK